MKYSALVCLLALAIRPASATASHFPENAVVDVTRPPFNAKGDGKTDDTAAIQQALTDKHPLIYLPAGTYVISETLRWGGGTGAGSAWKNQVLQGDGPGKSILKLADTTAKFGKPAEPHPMVWTGKAPAQRFRNGLRDLTFDVGAGNPGAIGARFVANNQGCIRNVHFVAPTGSGLIGLDLGYTDEQGPCLIERVTVRGFNTGIFLQHAVNSVTMEDIQLEGQTKEGILNLGQPLSIRNLTSSNTVPALVNEAGAALTTIVGANLQGGAADNAAIVNKAAMFLRDIRSSGYSSALKSNEESLASPIEEWVSHEPLTLFPTKVQSLNLPFKAVPEVPFDKPADWADVTKFGPPTVARLKNAGSGKALVALDWTAALQKAIDSGASTVYFPPVAPSEVGKHAAQADTSGLTPKEIRQLENSSGYGLFGEIHLRKNVRRVIGCESPMHFMVSSNRVKSDYDPAMRPTFILEDGEPPVVIVERFGSWFMPFRFEQRSKRTLVVSSLSFYDLETFPGTGDVFLDDVRTKQIIVRESSLWGRQVNPEGWEEPRVLCDGGNVCILGLKTETDATAGIVRNGGKMEILGGFNYNNKNEINPKRLFVNEGSFLSLTTAAWKTKPARLFDEVVVETRDGATKSLAPKDVPSRGEAFMVPLYVGGNSGKH